MQLSATIDEKDGRATLTLSGDLCDGAAAVLADTARRLTASSVAIDCAGIGTINSSGARDWVYFLETMLPRCKIELVRLSTACVENASLVAPFTDGTKILSVFVPFLCPKCHSGQDELFEVEGGAIAKKDRDLSCSQCKARLEPEVDLDDYFNFV